MTNRKEYLVTTRVGNFSRTKKWNGIDPYVLDHPPGWTLESWEEGFRVVDLSSGNVIARTPSGYKAIFPIPELQQRIEQWEPLMIGETAPNEKTIIELEPANNSSPDRALVVEVRNLTPVSAPYINKHDRLPTYGKPQQIFIFHGLKYFLLKYRPIGKSFIVRKFRRKIFSYEEVNSKFQIKALRNDIKVKVGSHKIVFRRGDTISLTPEEFFSSVILYGVNWWRFKRIPSPDELPPLVEEETEDERRDQRRFWQATRFVAASLLLLLISSMVVQTFSPKMEKPVEKVEIKVAKVIPHKEKLLPPPPKLEPVKPESVKPEPEKIVKVAPPPPPPPPPPKPKQKIVLAKPKVKAKEKLAAAAPPPPLPVDKKPLKPMVLPAAPKPAERAEPPPPEVAAAQNLSKSLSFLSPNKGVTKKSNLPSYTMKGKENLSGDPAFVLGTTDKSVLDNMATSTITDSKISTRSSRSIGSEMSFGNGEKGKGLNKVQGKVSNSELFNPGGRAGGSLEGEGGLSVAGPGQLSDAEIEKALAKYLSKFQYCYEKALLSNASLSGNIWLQWTINTSGSVGNAKVVNSELADAELHKCLIGILKGVPFPAPKGGPVVPKKRFNFKSTTI
jgi:outer membrane biosynthesis protein TonB